MKKIFTFLVAFLTTVSGAVWGQDYQVLTSGNAVSVDGDGAYYFTTNGQQIENGGIKVTDDSPTIHLKDVNIKAGGSAIIIENGANPTIIVEGENTIMSSSDPTPAIRVGNVYGSATNVSLTIEGTGILKIEMSEDNGIAIGNCQVGGAMGPCGSVTINSSTVQTNGRIGHFTGHAFRFGGNAIVIANDIKGFDHNDKNMRRGGLLFLNDDTPNVGEFHTPEQDPEFTLSSPLPEPYKIEVRSGGVEVTIGNGQSLTESQVDLQGGTLNAYKVVYNMNKLTDLNSVTPATVPSIYCGANTSLATIEPTLNPADTYHYFGWANGSNIITQTDGTTPNKIENVDAKAVWVVDTKNVTAKEGAPITEFSLVYPETVTGISFALAENTSLPDALTKTNNKISGTLNANGTTTYTASYGDKSETVTLNFEVTETPYDLSDEDSYILTVEELTYNGLDQTGNANDNVQVLDVAKGTNLSKGNYDVSYAPSVVKDAGQYTVTVTGKNAYEGTLTGTLNVKKADATVTAENVEWTIGTAGPTFTNDIFKATGVEADKGKLTVASFTNPTGKWDKAGVYKITYTDIKLNDDLAGNYNEVADVEGTLTVKKTGGEGGEEINPGDHDDDETEIIPGTDTDQDGWEWVADNKRYERTYDGEPHPLSTISLKYKNEEGKTAWETLSSDKFSVEYSSTPVKDVVENTGYTATITITGSEYYSGTATMKLYINPRPMVIDINKLTAEDVAGITEEKPTVTIGTEDVTFKAVEGKEESGIVEKEKDDAVVNGTITVTPTTSTEEGKKAYTITINKDGFKLSGVDGGKFAETNYTATYTYNGQSIESGTITETIDDITPGDDTDINDGDEDGNEWTWNGESYEVVYDGKPHGISSVTIISKDGLQTSTNVKVSYKADDATASLGGQYKEPLTAGHYTATVVVLIEGTEKTGTFPLWIKQRPLGVHFNLDDYILKAGGVYDAVDVAEYEPVEIEKDVWVGGELKDEEPVLEGTIKVADTPNSADKYAVTFNGVKLVSEGSFDVNNYDPRYYLNGELLDLDGNGDGTAGGEDEPDKGIDISEPDDETGISGIGTKRYRLYLANKDYNVVDAKADYAAEGLELFSRHDKKYTKVGGSFTVWYEKDGVANAGGYRIFWSNRANGDYKEVKFDTVSEYFQIRNVQSNVYVKIYAADGFPVGNEEISAADYRAYAQPNKIVVITPQPTDVQIISMAGAVVATDKVTGQREFANLTEGVYIVRMGETVVKLQVRK